jgi:hypothetical protein
MKLSELRARFPEYRDIDDEDLIESVYSSAYPDMSREEFLSEILDEEKEDLVVPALNKIDDSVALLSEIARRLYATVVDSADYSKVLTDIQTSIKGLSKDISNLPAPIVKVEAPIVNVEAPNITLPAPIVNVEAPIVTMPKQEIVVPKSKQWDFKIHRDSNGYIQNVTATEVSNVKK